MTTASGPRARLSPSFVVAVVALVLLSGGVGYAAGQVTSAQIKDGTIQSRDVADRSLTGVDLKPASVPRTRLRCEVGEARAFGGCVRRKPYPRSTFAAAVDSCTRRGGRLPTTGEIKYIASHDEFGWADGNPNQYEFSGSYTSEEPFTPLGFDRNGFSVYNASAQYFWHHCITG